MSDNELRDRIKAVLNDHRIEATGPGEVSCRCEHEWRPTYSYRNHLAQAIIDDLGLTVDSHFEHKAGSAIEMNETQAEYDERVKPRTFHRVVGKWEKQ